MGGAEWRVRERRPRPAASSEAQAPSRHFDRSGASGEIRPATGAGQAPELVASTERPPGFSPSTSLRACPERSRRGRLLRPGPRAGPPVEMTDWGGGMTGEGAAAEPSPRRPSPCPLPRGEGAYARRLPHPSFRPGVPPPVISTEAKRVEKSGRRRAPARRKSLWRRRSARRVSPLRLRSEPALSEAEGAGYSAPARRAGAPVEMTGERAE